MCVVRQGRRRETRNCDSKPETITDKMEIDFTTDPWINKRVLKLFLPSQKEHPKDAIARRIDILMEARSEPDGYKEIIDGGHEYSNCTIKDIIKLNDKCIYLISALTIALKHFPKKNMERVLPRSKSNLQHICYTLFRMNN